jgi:type II secretory ATPase GspE/PulE/Tfp pilus assembly ATPase PilB-like protein
MSNEVYHRMAGIASRAHGIILATGPTGSGKTTTLYAALGLRHPAEEKIITVEDPVEYHLAGITQVPVHGSAGVTFASVLRSLLRQDPDVLLVGEMRDSDTAHIAIQAAMTGHLVLSTLHTNDSLSALPRLMDLGIAPYMIAATVEGIVAQRLVRRSCPHCRERYRPRPEGIALLSQEPTADPQYERGRGCAHCRHTGYFGRIGVFELLVLDDGMKDAIARGCPASEVRSVAVAQGMTSLRNEAWRLVTQGITTVEEALRVVCN